jgi:hypothetical protein
MNRISRFGADDIADVTKVDAIEPAILASNTRPLPR